MFARDQVRVESGKSARTYSANSTAWSSLMIFLLAGALHATSITDIKKLHPPRGGQIASAKDVRGPLKMMAEKPNFLPPMNSGILLTGSNFAAVSSTDRSAAVELPEPRSFVLFGAGLLAMLGIVRRRVVL